jgi:CheY-like chemotaxis protein
MIESGFIPTASPNSLNLVQPPSQLLPFRTHQPASPVTAGQPSLRESELSREALIVDDVADVTEMLSVLLTHAGYEVATAACARDALTLARARQFDVIISDIGMPEMNGYELATALRSLPGYERVPLVAVTGYSMFDDRDRSLTAGFNEHVTKPIDPRAFLELLEHL